MSGDTSRASVPIYCINLASSVDRRRRMVQRFGALGLLDRVRFVPAVPARSRVVDQHLVLAGTPEAPAKRRAEVGCHLSHVRALRTFLRETTAHVSAGIVFEDDVLLHREWHDRIEAVLSNLPDGAAVCCLGYAVNDWTGFSWGGRRPEEQNLARIDPEAMWGSYAYWFSRDHVQAILREYLTVASDPNLVSEFIVARPGGFAAHPPLTIEDGTTSTIRDEDEMPQHRRVFSAWGVANYLPDEATEHALGSAEPDRARQTIRLCMIVRNESQVIDRCARSVQGLVDSWLICDTGSTDDTPARVRAAFADLPGELHHHEWKDFGTNRSRMLDLARGTADYLLLLDADQTVRLTGSLPHLSSEAYSLLVDESVAHWVPRLVRGDLPWRYVGAAHEYLTCDEPHHVERLPELVVEHHADGGAQVNKVDRNRELLERHLAEHPDDSRSIFYLAQTLREAGDLDRAIELYARRIELGGWPEELFYSHFRHAELVSRSDWDRGVGLLLKAWDYRPSRAEPLYELAQGYRVRGNHRLAEHFAAKGLEIAYPDDVLFVHRDLYEWGLEFEWSIAAYWLGDAAGALAANDRLLRNPSLPARVRKFVVGNRQHCLDALESSAPASATPPSAPASGADLTPTLTALMPSASLGEVRLETDPPWPHFNPSIAGEGDGFRLLVRSSNYVIDEGRYGTIDGDPVIRTIYYQANLDADLSLTAVRAVTDAVSPMQAASYNMTVGLEDVRIVAVGSRWFGLGATRAHNPAGRGEMALVELMDGRFERLRLLASPHPDRHEKNWMPFLVDGRLLVVYSCEPTVVLHCDVESGQILPVSTRAASPILVDERGGSQGVAVEGGFMFVTHHVDWETGQRVYRHRFLLLDSDYRMVAASPRFRFMTTGVEFCAGLARHGHELLLSFGVGDRGAYLARVAYEDVRSQLEPL